MRATTALLLIAGCAAQPDGREGVLTFNPSAPTAGEPIAVEYTPAPELRGEDVLRLRVRFRRPPDRQFNDWSVQVAAADLERGRGGVFRGSFTLPAEAVFATFAVEDLTGEVVDHNGQALWELLVHGPDGRPLSTALNQKSNDLTGRNWREAHRASLERYELYPDDLDARMALEFYQEQVLGPDSLEAALADHRVAFYRLDAEYEGRSDLDAEQLGLMWMHLFFVDDTARIDKWKRRLVDEAPASEFGVMAQMIDMSDEVFNDDVRLLEAMDSFWDDGIRLNGDLPTYYDVVRLGLQSAIRLRDESAVQRWMDRNTGLSHSPWGTGSSLPADLIEHGVLVRDAVADLEEVLAGYETDPHTDRYLTHSVSQHRQRIEPQVLRALVALGKGLLILADTSSARVALRDAATRPTWNASSFVSLGQVLLDLDDVDAAAEVAARIAVDPAEAGSAAADSLIDAVRSRVTDNRWSALETDAEDLMRRMTSLEDVNRPLPADPLVMAGDGGETLFSEAMGGDITLVAFWSRFCGPSIHELPQLQATSSELSQLGVRTIAITDEAASPELAEFLVEQEFHMPIYHDLRNEARLSLNQYATPSYYLLDGRGRIRFQETSLEAIRRQVRVLKRDPG